MLFSKVIGHATLKAKLIGNIREGRVAHAQLFLGPRGSGNLPLALSYAQYILCSNPDAADACGVCTSCVQASKLEHPDLHLIFPIFLRKRNPRCANTTCPLGAKRCLRSPIWTLTSGGSHWKVRTSNCAWAWILHKRSNVNLV
ncbi:MAG: hypothetical protein IPI91_00490 [Flavobacteriales bacterium]|nr:hypothetical protein [Flavobacteriales bacterium]